MMQSTPRKPFKPHTQIIKLTFFFAIIIIFQIKGIKVFK